MSVAPPPTGASSSRTLNEVLIAELDCLRPGLTTGACEKDRLTAATFQVGETIRAANLKEIYGRIGEMPEPADGRRPHEPLSALCLSGGGIRSATFNLGVLQALARIGLLGKFDYLSSVSGGGYIASWLRAWMHRRGVQQVVDELGGRDKGPASGTTEPAPVSNLRDYSNYLTPKIGLFSGDTWSLVATVIRNLLLNWLVLVPLLGVMVGIPLLFILYIRTAGLPAQLPQCLLALAVAIEIVASVLIYRARRFAKSPDIAQGYFVVRCVLPVCLAAAALSSAGVGLQLPWSARTPNPGPEDLRALWGFALVWSIVVPLIGWSIAELMARFGATSKKRTAGKEKEASPSDAEIARTARQVSAGLEVIALVASGLIGAALFVGAVTWWFSFLYNHPALYVILAFPGLLCLYLLSRVVFIGLISLSDERGERPVKITDCVSPAHVRSRVSSNDADREWWSRLSGWVLLIVTSWVTVTGICLIGCYLPNVIWGTFRITHEYHDIVTNIVKIFFTVVSFVSGAIAALTASSSQTSGSSEGSAGTARASVKRILAIAAPLFMVSLIMVLSWGVKALAEASIGPENLFTLRFNKAGALQPVALESTVEFVVLLAVLALAALGAGRIANINRFSLHGMYRNRLVRAYLGASNCPIDEVDRRVPDPFTGFSLTDNIPLHCLCSPIDKPGELERPLSIINTTLNLVHGEKLAWQQRKAESFSMSPLFCGNRSEGYRDSREYGGPGGLTVGTAVTISGAAANPNMGYSSSPVLGFLMAIFNVRLGAWLGNTNQHGDRSYTHPGPRHAIVPLFAEMFGLTNSSRRYVNLSDGGHFDNLGLYEVVMRRCRHVLVSDAGHDVGQDGSFSFEDLGNCIRKIRVDFGINITFDKIQILPNTPEKEGLCCAIGTIHYSDVDGTAPEEDGLLIYIKPTLRGRGAQVPYDVYSYSRESVSFPHETTVDQWFSESQFESYRALGSHILSQLTTSLRARGEATFEDFHTSVSFYVTGELPGMPQAPEAAEQPLGTSIERELAAVQ
jgi:hypothetical protein